MKFRHAPILLLVLAAAVFWYIRTRPVSTIARLNVVLATKPISIWSWDREGRTFSILLLPPDVAVDAPSYGRYELESLWKLGFIDKLGGAPLTSTLEKALAIPVPYYAGFGRQGFVDVSDAAGFGRKFFSLTRLPMFYLSGKPTNVPILTAFSFAWALWRAKPENVTVIDIGKRSPVGRETLPDGTVRLFLDRERVDVLLKGELEDDRIRREEASVAVYNTTKTPDVGSQAARFFTNQGMLVVAVGNDEPQRDRCEVSTSKELLDSVTVRVIAELFSCKVSEGPAGVRADIIVSLGTDVASRW